MTVYAAALVLISTLTLLHMAMTVGIIRRLRNPSISPLLAAVRPPQGFRLDLSREAGEWAPEAQAMSAGDTLVAIVGPGCAGCDALHAELRTAGRLDVPLYVLADAHLADTPAGEVYLESWETATQRFFAPRPFGALESFGRPDSVPAVLLLHDGIVLSNARRLRDLTLPVRSTARNA